MTTALEKVKQAEQALKEAREELERQQNDVWIPADGQPVLVGHLKWPRISTGKLDGNGCLICYTNNGREFFWETWEPATYIPTVTNKIPHDGSSKSPIKNGVLYIAENKKGSIICGTHAEGFSWLDEEWYAILED